MTIPSFYMNGDWELPSINGYSTSVAAGSAYGNSGNYGRPIIRKDYASQPLPFSAQYDLMTQRDVQVFCQFYYGAIMSGQRRFYAKLHIAGNFGIYVCQLVDAPQVSDWTGYSAKITMNMLIQLDLLKTMEEGLINVQAIIPLLPYATDPLAYTL